ncbi:MAG: hypothetical protein GC146_12580 [Limimaricola sp.]|uniref:excalibur calcium-binding domain-containing protein n=1 Tax=Limimaricola sp. TaxID=2211665 RepID=UPI001D383BE7|nr:excalibur calcium-binding domain-containing protein [Limimaricola sp.]MBI1418049.1 hypothetical protein [Limimaricola sp.]
MWRCALVFLVLTAAPAAADPSSPVLGIGPVSLTGQILLARAFSCARKTCTQMQSCEEACYHLIVCGESARDGDHDGIPCENLCRTRCPPQ